MVSSTYPSLATCGAAPFWLGPAGGDDLAGPSPRFTGVSNRLAQVVPP